MTNGKGFNQQRKDRRDKGQEQKDPIITRIEQVQSFREITPEEYATIGGFAEQVVLKGMKREMKTTQLRKFFTKIKNLENKLKGQRKEEPLSNEFKNEVYMILPELAYSKARGLIYQGFYELITTIIRSKDNKSKLNTVDDFRNFSKFMTAIVAYKKLHGG